MHQNKKKNISSKMLESPGPKYQPYVSDWLGIFSIRYGRYVLVSREFPYLVYTISTEKMQVFATNHP